MIRLIGQTNINFMGARKVAFIISALALLAGVVSLIAHGGPHYSIDFAGGRLIELAFVQETVPASDVRDALASIGLSDVEVQNVDSGGATGANPGVILRFKEEALTTDETGGSPTAQIITALKERVSGLEVDVRREESVGPKIGSELRGDAIKAIAFALGAILIYISIRYELIFAIGAVVALFHDLMVTLGLFSLLNLELSLPIVAALLTIAGYSINDTIVLFDRIRERRKAEQRKSFEDVINGSINQMLSRTIVTSVTTLFAALSLYLFGGAVIHDFAFAIVVGVVIGTYSSIFIASALVLTIQLERDRRSHTRRKSTKTAVAR
jgi:preprotein translocase SecF subunit